jgi:hypothetical protein
MSSAFREFMNGLVDYAGLFPPASLDMESAISQYAGFSDHADTWMLGRFIVPAGRLNELAEAAEKHRAALGGWEVSALLGDRQDAGKSLDSLPNQCQAILDFEKNFLGRATVEVLEIPLPGQLPPDALPEFLHQYLGGVKNSGVHGKQVFFELPPKLSAEFELPVLKSIAELGSSLSPSQENPSLIGAKLRCGGVTPEAFPTVERVARVLALCRDLDLPLKCTAGLHHPVRHQATEPAVMMHGFLNVFGAGVLAHALGWNEVELAEVIADTDPKSFAFEAGVFRWHNHTVDTETLRQLRQRYLCGFGSCSFDEPRDDLQNLGML